MPVAFLVNATTEATENTENTEEQKSGRNWPQMHPESDVRFEIQGPHFICVHLCPICG
jgi:hypothetical protein